MLVRPSVDWRIVEIQDRERSSRRLLALTVTKAASMALKDLIATPGEATASRIVELFRYSGEAREQLWEAIEAAVTEAVAAERAACREIVRIYGHGMPEAGVIETRIIERR